MALTARIYFALFNLTVGGLFIITSVLGGVNIFSQGNLSTSATFIFSVGVGMLFIGTLFLWPEIEQGVEKVG